MNTRPIVGTIPASGGPDPRSTRITGVGTVLFGVFFLLGSLTILYPSYVLECFAAFAAVGFTWMALRYLRSTGLETWQIILITALTGYILLNYGFENLTIHLGLPIIISYVLMFSSLFLVAFSRPQWFMRAQKEPAVRCLLALLVLSFFHLILDVPTYGFYAIRDASMFFDGLFVILGLLWAMKGRNGVIPLMKWLTVVLLLNLAYSYTFPWSEKIAAWSPRSGVFLQIPLLGNYRGNANFLLLGALFYLFLARTVVRWPRWILVLLAAAQLFGLAIHQLRGLYVALGVVLILFVLLGETRKSAKLLFILSPAIAAVLLLTTLGIEIQGRIGPVKSDFFKEHFRSISGAEGTPGSALQGRVDMYQQAFQHIRAHPVAGEGFGMVLVDFTDEDKPGTVAVRQPHNSTVSVLARLGAIGLVVWLAFHFYVLKSFFYALRQRRYWDKQLAELLVWLFMVYVIYMIEASLEAGFEFPSGAFPFYFFVGLALGLIRYVPKGKQKPAAASSLAVVAV